VASASTQKGDSAAVVGGNGRDGSDGARGRGRGGRHLCRAGKGSLPDQKKISPCVQPFEVGEWG
jgi:hypothetical protein